MLGKWHYETDQAVGLFSHVLFCLGMERRISISMPENPAFSVWRGVCSLMTTLILIRMFLQASRQPREHGKGTPRRCIMLHSHCLVGIIYTPVVHHSCLLSSAMRIMLGCSFKC